jgi:hypothetical protein
VSDTSVGKTAPCTAAADTPARSPPSVSPAKLLRLCGLKKVCPLYMELAEAIANLDPDGRGLA